jgi:hypothetical protein
VKVGVELTLTSPAQPMLPDQTVEYVVDHLDGIDEPQPDGLDAVPPLKVVEADSERANRATSLPTSTRSRTPVTPVR